jgi:hypothetical protein
MAEREVPELSQKFVLNRDANSYLAFRTAARGMQAEAESRKEVLDHPHHRPVKSGPRRELARMRARVEVDSRPHPLSAVPREPFGDSRISIYGTGWSRRSL